MCKNRLCVPGNHTQMPPDNRRLPPFLSYIAARLGGRPLEAFLWYFCVFSMCGGMGMPEVLSGNQTSTEFWVVTVFCALDFVALCAIMLSIAMNDGGWRWLLTDYRDEQNNAVDSGSRFLVRMIPVMGLIVVVEYLVLR